MGDSSDDWEFQRIGTASEKSSVEKELAELRERLAKVDEWKSRKAEIEEELNRVWVQGGDDGEESGELAPPSYLESEVTRSEGASEEVVESAGTEEEAAEEEAVESRSPSEGENSGTWSPQFRPNS